MRALLAIPLHFRTHAPHSIGQQRLCWGSQFWTFANNPIWKGPKCMILIIIDGQRGVQYIKIPLEKWVIEQIRDKHVAFKKTWSAPGELWSDWHQKLKIFGCTWGGRILRLWTQEECDVISQVEVNQRTPTDICDWC